MPDTLSCLLSAQSLGQSISASKIAQEGLLLERKPAVSNATRMTNLELSEPPRPVGLACQGSPLKLGLAQFLALTLVLSACEPAPDKQASASPKAVSVPSIPDAEYLRAATIIAASCMPCHNRQSLPKVSALTRAAKFKAIGGDTRLRILGELGELKAYMDSGMPISFTSKDELQQFFAATAGEFYVMLEKGVMPPPWAPELMQRLNLNGYQKLGPQQRLELLRFAKPYTEEYLR